MCVKGLGTVYPTFTPGKKPISSMKTEGKGLELERVPVVSEDEGKRRLRGPSSLRVRHIICHESSSENT